MLSGRTIPRNATCKIGGLQAMLRHCQVFNKDNYYMGEPATPESAWTVLKECRKARLIALPDGTYRVDLNDSKWFVLSA